MVLANVPHYTPTKKTPRKTVVPIRSIALWPYVCYNYNMDNIGAGGSQANIILHLSREESETAIAAFSFAIRDGFNTLEYNWDADAYRRLTNSAEEAIGDIDRIASRIEQGCALLVRLSIHRDNPTADLELSDAEFERLGYALYAYGVTGFHRALCATHAKIVFANSEDKSHAIDKLNQQNERAFMLFKRLEQCKRDVEWMAWPQANMEHKFAPAR